MKLIETKNHLQLMREMDVSHPELGEANGFSGCEAAKSSACDYVDELLALVEEHGHKIDSDYLCHVMLKVHDKVVSMYRQLAEVEGIVAKGLHVWARYSRGSRANRCRSEDRAGAECDVIG